MGPVKNNVPKGSKNVAVLLVEFETRLQLKKMLGRGLQKAPENRFLAQGWDSRPLVKSN